MTEKKPSKQSRLSDSEREMWGRRAEQLNRDRRPNPVLYMTTGQLLRVVHDILHSVNFADSVPDHVVKLLRIWCMNLGAKLLADGRGLRPVPQEPLDIVGWVREAEVKSRQSAPAAPATEQGRPADGTSTADPTATAGKGGGTKGLPGGKADLQKTGEKPTEQRQRKPVSKRARLILDKLRGLPESEAMTTFRPAGLA